MTANPDRTDARHPLPPTAEPPDAAQQLKLQRRKRLELTVNFAIVIALLAVLLIGFCLFAYKRMTG